MSLPCTAEGDWQGIGRMFDEWLPQHSMQPRHESVEEHGQTKLIGELPVTMLSTILWIGTYQNATNEAFPL